MKWRMLMIGVLFAPLLQAAQAPGKGSSVTVAEPVASGGDPMRPPPFALRQYRLEKMKQNAPAPVSRGKPVSGKRWVLNSTLYGAGRKRAIVNGRLLAIGERIDGARLVAIERDRVTLERQGRRQTLKLETARLRIKNNRKR